MQRSQKGQDLSHFVWAREQPQSKHLCTLSLFLLFIFCFFSGEFAVCRELVVPRSHEGLPYPGRSCRLSEPLYSLQYLHFLFFGSNRELQVHPCHDHSTLSMMMFLLPNLVHHYQSPLFSIALSPDARLGKGK